MKALILTLLLTSIAAAEPAPEIFGPVDSLESVTISSLSNPAASVTAARKDGVLKFQAMKHADNKSEVVRELKKEEFAKCYHLACRAFRAFERKPYKFGSSWESRMLTIRGTGPEHVMVMFDVGAFKENPLLEELLQMMAELAKAK
jgi:hypothetical protein